MARGVKHYFKNGKEYMGATHKDKKGKFGRVLGEMYVAGRNINLMMVDDSHAVKYEGQSKKDIEDEHLVNRQTLIEKKLFNPHEVK